MPRPKAALHLTYGPMGELGPFFVMTAQRAAITAGRADAGRARLEALRATALAATGGMGIGASVFGQDLGFHAVMHGNVARARTELATADPHHWRTRLYTAVLALVTTNPRRAMRELAAAEPQTRALRQVEVRRVALLALARFEDGDQDDTLALLGRLSQQLGAFDHELVAMLSPKLLARVGESMSGLRQHDPRAPYDEGVLERPRLSTSELNVLAGLHRGLSRDEIAETRFVSPNTVTTQLASLYCKLGVSSATAAVTEAVRLGLL